MQKLGQADSPFFFPWGKSWLTFKFRVMRGERVVLQQSALLKGYFAKSELSELSYFRECLLYHSRRLRTLQRELPHCRLCGCVRMCLSMCLHSQLCITWKKKKEMSNMTQHETCQILAGLMNKMDTTEVQSQWCRWHRSSTSAVRPTQLNKQLALNRKESINVLCRMEQDRNLIRNNRGEKERERKIPLSQLFPITCSVNVPGQHHTSQNVSIVPHPASWSAFFLITRYSTGLFTSSLFAEPLPFVSPFWHVLSLLLLSLDLHISSFLPNEVLLTLAKTLVHLSQLEFQHSVHWPLLISLFGPPAEEILPHLFNQSL